MECHEKHAIMMLLADERPWINIAPAIDDA
jgi:hypothetical protein